MHLVLGTISVLVAPVGAMAHVGHVGELAGHSHWVGVAAVVVMLAIGMIPGMPIFAFASLAGGTFYLSRRAHRIEEEQEKQTKLGLAGKTATADSGDKSEQETLEDLL